MNKKRLYQPLMRRLPDHGHDNYFIVDGYSQELLLKIRDLLDVLAPIGDDHRHGLWIEVPRGKPSDWATFKEVKDCDEDVKTREDYLEYWKSEFPRETYWYFISVSQYKVTPIFTYPITITIGAAYTTMQNGMDTTWVRWIGIWNRYWPSYRSASQKSRKTPRHTIIM